MGRTLDQDLFQLGPELAELDPRVPSDPLPTGQAEAQPLASSLELLDEFLAILDARLSAVILEGDAGVVEGVDEGAALGLGPMVAAATVDKVGLLLAQALHRHHALRRRIQATGHGPNAPVFARALSSWRLGPIEELLVVAAIAVHGVPDLADKLARLDARPSARAHAPALTIGAAARLLRAGPRGILRLAAFVAPSAPLFDLAILRPVGQELPLAERPLRLAERVLALVHGNGELDPAIAPVFAVPAPAVSDADDPVIVQLREGMRQTREITVVSADDRDEGSAAVQLAALREGRPAFELSARRFLAASHDVRAALLREALFARSVLALRVDCAPEAVSELCAACAATLAWDVPVLALTLAHEPAVQAVAAAMGPTRRVRVPRPDRAARARAWRARLGPAAIGAERVGARVWVTADAAERAAAESTRGLTLARPLDPARVLAAVRARGQEPPGCALAPAPLLWPAAVRARMDQLVALRDERDGLILGLITGPWGAGKSAAASAIAAALDLVAVEFDAAAVAHGDARREPAFAAVVAAALDGARRGYAPVLDRMDELGERAHEFSAALVRAFERGFGLVLLCARSADAVPAAVRRRVAVVVELPDPA